MSNNSSNKRIAKNTLFLSMRMVIVLVISLYTTRVVLQELGVVDYGVYNVVCGFVALFAFLNNSMSNGIQRFYNYEYGKSGEEGANQVYSTSIYIQSLLALMVVVMVEIFGLWYLHNKMVIPAERMMASELIFQLFVFMFVIGILEAPFSAAVVAHEKLDFYAIVSILDALLKLAIVFLLRIIPNDKLIIYGVLTSIIVFLNLLIYYMYCKKNFREIRFYKKINYDLFKKMIGFSGWNLFGSFSLVMENQGINLVMNFFYGPVVNAARGVANQINGGVQSFVQNITLPVRPQVTQSFASGDIERTMSLTYGVSKISSAVLLIFAMPASIEINYILNIWLGDNVPLHTSTFTILILLTSLVNNMNAAISGVVHAKGVMRDYQLWSSVARVSSVIIAFLLIRKFEIPELGLVAVFICSVLSHSIGLIIVRGLVNMSLRRYLFKVAMPIFEIMIISIIFILPVHLLLEEGVIRLLLVVITSLLSLGILFFYISFDDSERKLSMQMMKPIINFIKK